MSTAPASAAIKLRAARRGDADPVKAILTELVLPADAATFTWVIQHPEMKVVVATDVLDKAVGVVALSHRPQIQLGGRIVTIDMVIVAQAWRRKGVGRALLDAAVKEARVFAAKQVEVRANAAEAGTVQFLEKCGFARLEQGVFRLGP